MVVLGEKEKDSNLLTVEKRNGGKISDISLEKFIVDLKKEIEDKIYEEK